MAKKSKTIWRLMVVLVALISFGLFYFTVMNGGMSIINSEESGESSDITEEENVVGQEDVLIEDVVSTSTPTPTSTSTEATE